MGARYALPGRGRWAGWLGGLLLVGALATCTPARERVPEASLHTRLSPPQPGEWLYHHPEAGQSFEAYVAAKPVLPTKARRKLYLLPLGDFDAVEKQALATAAAYLEAMWGLPVVVQPPQGRATLPDSALRTRRDGTEQLHTKVCAVPGAAAPAPARCPDLPGHYDHRPVPGPGLELRVRPGGPARAGGRVVHGPVKEYDAQGQLLAQRLVQRLVKTVAHETTHAFSIPHCREFRCLMNGSNSLEEADRKPFSTCPDCTRKVRWASRVEPRTDAQAETRRYYQRLLRFYEAHRWADEAAFCRRVLAWSAN
jgi:archaemetzincin